MTPPVTWIEESPGALPGSVPPPATHAVLDLASALELAARHNRSISAAGAALDAAAGDVAVARSALLPSAGVHGAYNWYTTEQTSVPREVTFQFPPNSNTTIAVSVPGIPIREQDFGTIEAAAKLAIDLSGELRHGLSAAQASYRAEAARAWATRLEEERAVTAAYFGLLEAEQLRAVSARTVALHERQRSDASARFEQGRLTRNNVLVVDVALTGAKQTLLQLDNAIASARRTLNRATGLAIEAPTQPQDVSGRPRLPSLEASLADARAGNPLITSMLEETRAADERLTSARRGRFPRFSATGGYNATTADVFVPHDYGFAGASVDMDLWSFRREGEIAKLEAASRRSRLLLDRSVREIESLVRDAHDRVRERLAAIEAASVGVGQAEENLRIRQVQFDEGRATSEDLLDAAELDTRQRAALASALYQAHARRAELQQLIGKPLSELEEAHEPVTGERRPLANIAPAPLPPARLPSETRESLP